MELESLIQTHGYWLLVVGCLLEGETILAMAGFAAHRGYLRIEWVIALAAAAGFAGDQFYFWLGRCHGARLLTRFPRLARQAARVHAAIERHHAWVVVGVRFAYGLRIAGPILIGMSPLRATRFAAFNALGALLWAGAIAGLGWVFGRAIEAVLGEVRDVEIWLLAAIAAFGVLAWWWHRRRERRARG